MITLKFNESWSQNFSDNYSFKTYKEFFEFYMKFSSKGTIFDVKDDGKTE